MCLKKVSQSLMQKPFVIEYRSKTGRQGEGLRKFPQISPKTRRIEQYSNIFEEIWRNFCESFSIDYL